jgi:hypothetical protein
MTESILLTIVSIVCILTTITLYQYLKDAEEEKNKIQFK